MESMLVERVIKLAEDAGTIILATPPMQDHFIKSDGSIQTAADRAAHDYLCAKLNEYTPNIPILSEENDNLDCLHEDEVLFWLIDPLDGTKNFATGGQNFTVNIALIQDGYVHMAVIVAPALHTTYWGIRHQGAFFRQGQGNVQKIHVKKFIPEQDALWLMSPSDHVIPFVHQMTFPEVQIMSSSIKFCRVAEGYADAYLRQGPTCSWDTAAGQGILEAAGGYVLTLEGNPLLYHPSQRFNPPFLACAYQDALRCLTISSPKSLLEA